jgi:hypothetical protein
MADCSPPDRPHGGLDASVDKALVRRIAVSDVSTLAAWMNKPSRMLDGWRKSIGSPICARIVKRGARACNNTGGFEATVTVAHPCHP